MHRILAATFAAALSWTGLASAQVPDVDIPFEQFELENGLWIEKAEVGPSLDDNDDW